MKRITKTWMFPGARDASVWGLATLLAAALVGCGGGASTGTGAKTGGGDKSVSGSVLPGGGAVSREAQDAFTSAVAEFRKHEEAKDWDDAKCDSVANQFLSAGKAQGGVFPAAHYNAGIVQLRCAREDTADKEFETALAEKRELAAASSDPKLKSDPEFHQVWVQKALIRYRKGDASGISEAIDMIRTKGFDPDGSQNVEAFVNLGMLYRERSAKDSSNPETKKKDDFGLVDDLARSQFWLQNALSINDSFMPAYNQLALYYLDRARAVGAKKDKPKAAVKPKTKEDAEKSARDSKIKADLTTLELGLLVSEEASRRDPNYAGIWNTQGLLLLEMNRTGGATKAFKAATEKDPKFFEAWMNYAAINLAFRGYAEATKGYQAAAQIRPKDYDAKLGLAVATRGQLDYHLTTKQSLERTIGECQDPEKAGRPKCADALSKGPAVAKEHEAKFLDFYKQAVTAYDAARDTDPSRPEAYFNKALLIEKYKAKSGQASSAETYRESEKLYQEVVAKFGANDKYKKLVEDAKSRAEEAAKAAKFEEDAAKAPPPPPAAPPPSASAAGSASGAAAAAAPSGSAAGPAASGSAAPSASAKK